MQSIRSEFGTGLTTRVRPLVEVVRHVAQFPKKDKLKKKKTVL